MKHRAISGIILISFCLTVFVSAQSLSQRKQEEPGSPVTASVSPTTGEIGKNGPPEAEDPVLKIDTALLNIPVIVSDREGHTILGLKKEDFYVYRDGKRQEVEFFANDEAPIHVALILDTSMSARSVIGRITKAAREFVGLLGPYDAGMIVTFDNQISILQALTSDQKKLRNAIGDVFIADHGGSNMNDAVYRVVTKDLSAIQGRKAAIVLTDGKVWGKVTPDRLRDELIESDVLLYPIFYYTGGTFAPGTKINTYADLINTPPGGYLNSLAVATGARLYAADGGDFAGAFQKVAEELRKQYVVGIQLNSLEESKDIKIRVNRPNAVVRYKGIFRLKKLTPRALTEGN